MRSIAFGRMLVRNTSARSIRSRAISRPASVCRSSTMLFFDRLSSSKIGLLGMSPPSMRWKVRAGSPDGGSILMTSAPQSARMPPAAGPATHTPISTTRTPSIGPLIDNLLSPPARASFYLTSWPLHSIVFALNDRPSVVILFVCTGNTCRSPMAAALLRHHLGVDATIEVASVGTIGWNGYPATPHAVAVLAERGIDLSAHISRKINRDDVERADVIIAMTRKHA